MEQYLKGRGDPDVEVMCQLCAKHFDVEQLIGHWKQHLSVTLFTCVLPNCLMTTDYDNFIKHLKEKDNSHQFKFTCLKCTHTEIGLTDYIGHLMRDQPIRERRRKGTQKRKFDGSKLVHVSIVSPTRSVMKITAANAVSWSPKISHIDGADTSISNSSDTSGYQLCREINHGKPTIRYNIMSNLYRQRPRGEAKLCKVCCKSIATADDEFRSHMNVHMKNTAYVCRNCKLDWHEFKDQVNIVKDKSKSMIKHDFRYYCSLCEKYNEGFDAHLEHLREDEELNHDSGTSTWTTIEVKQEDQEDTDLAHCKITDTTADLGTPQIEDKNCADIKKKVKLVTGASISKCKDTSEYQLCTEINHGRPTIKYNIMSFLYRSQRIGEEKLCKVCCQTIASNEFRKHMDVHVRNTAYVCCTCKLDWHDFKYHVVMGDKCKSLIKHDFRFYCSLCGRYNKGFEACLRHLRDEESNTDAVETSQCDSASVLTNIQCAHYDTFYLPKHYQSGHKIFFCRVCFKTFESNCRAAEVHFRMHNSPTMVQYGIGFVCSHCGECKTTIQEEHMEQHNHENKDSSMEPTFTCKSVTWSMRCYPHSKFRFKDGTEMCEATFANPHSLFYHVNSEHACVPRKTVTSKPISISPVMHTVPVPQEFSQHQVASPDSSSGVHEEGLQMPVPKLTRLEAPIQQTGHSVKLTIKPKIKIFVCKVCGKRFVEKHFFKQHLKRAGH